MPTAEERVLEILNRDHLTTDAETEALGLGSEAVEVLVRYARGGHPEGRDDLRSRAIVVLGSSTAPEHTRLLGEVLGTLEEEDRIRVMIALGRQGTDDAVNLVAQHAARPQATEAEFIHAARSISGSGNANSGQLIAQLRSSRTLNETMVAELDSLPGDGSAIA